MTGEAKFISTDDMEKALELLTKHQQWRLGFIGEMPCTPQELTTALDVAIRVLDGKVNPKTVECGWCKRRRPTNEMHRLSGYGWMCDRCKAGGKL